MRAVARTPVQSLITEVDDSLVSSRYAPVMVTKLPDTIPVMDICQGISVQNLL